MNRAWYCWKMFDDSAYTIPGFQYQYYNFFIPYFEKYNFYYKSDQAFNAATSMDP